MSGDFSVKTFISRFNKGFARPSRYRVEFTLPQGFNASPDLPGVNSNSAASNIKSQEMSLNRNGNINVMCHSCSLPQRTLLTYDHKQLAAPYRVPYSQSYDPVTFSFYADTDYSAREYFDIWQNAAINIGSNTVNYYNEFTSDVRITTIDSAGNDAYFVDLYEAYPINIGVIDLSYSTTNAVQTVTVTLSYKYWASSGNDTRVSRTA
jgi:hypothetical protein